MLNMLRFSRYWAVLCLTLAVGVVFSAAADAAELMAVRFGPNGEQTRVVFDLDGGSVYAISGDAAGEGRIFIDFTDLAVEKPARVFKSGKGHVARYGFADSPDGAASERRTRAVLELNKTARIKKAFMIPPAGKISKHRLVVDLQTADTQAFLASLPARGESRYPDLAAVIERATADPGGSAGRGAASSVPALTIPPAPSHKEAAASRTAGTAARLAAAGAPKVIVIDPGHGGVDPGAQGQRGTYEKTVNLAAALELEKIMKARGGYKVVLTRRGDETIRPDRREALAREAGADLFISIHADAIPQPQIRGASVYTLSEKGVARSANLARSQGNFHVYDLDLEDYDDVVSGILFDKAQDSTNTASSKFARKLVDNLTGKTPMLNRSHRTANFRVLLAPDVPAVLLEMAFISNSKDEKNLNSQKWRRMVMTGTADAIDQYFSEGAQFQRVANSVDGSAH